MKKLNAEELKLASGGLAYVETVYTITDNSNKTIFLGGSLLNMTRETLFVNGIENWDVTTSAGYKISDTQSMNCIHAKESTIYMLHDSGA